ncbi:MAG: hypothetical protein ABJN36_09475 [Cyclobacteriaceae bacterium]
MRKIAVLSILTLLFACNQQTKPAETTEQLGEIPSDTLINSVVADSTQPEQDIILANEPTPKFLPLENIDFEYSDEEYAAELFNDKLVNELRSRNIKFKYKTTDNLYVENLVDTMFTFIHNDDSITIYKTGDKEIVCFALLRSEELAKVSRVKIGMSEEQFGKVFELPDSVVQNNNTYRIADMMWAQFMDFDFRTGQLEQMKFTGYIE